MKKLLFLFVGLLMISCSSEDPEQAKTKTEKAAFTISSTENVRYEVVVMEALPSEGGPKITIQAEHYEISELVWNDSAIYYLYVPEAGFTGTETVEITNSLHNGAEVYEEVVTQLSIEVTE